MKFSICRDALSDPHANPLDRTACGNKQILIMSLLAVRSCFAWPFFPVLLQPSLSRRRPYYITRAPLCPENPTWTRKYHGSNTVSARAARCGYVNTITVTKMSGCTYERRRGRRTEEEIVLLSWYEYHTPYKEDVCRQRRERENVTVEYSCELTLETHPNEYIARDEISYGSLIRWILL